MTAQIYITTIKNSIFIFKNILYAQRGVLCIIIIAQADVRQEIHYNCSWGEFHKKEVWENIVNFFSGKLNCIRIRN